VAVALLSPLNLLRQAIAAARQGDRSQARMFLAKVTELDPEEPLGWLWRAALAESPEQALIWINRALDLDPEHRQARQALPRVRLQAAMAVAWSGDFPMARRLFHQAAEDDPASIVPWVELAAMAESPEEARQCLAEVLRREPNHAGAHRCLAHLEKERHATAPVVRRPPSTIHDLIPVEFDLPPEFEDLQPHAATPARATVMIVDDACGIRELVRKQVDGMGLRCIEASSAGEAVEILNAQGVPDLILLDGVMPGVNGFDLCHQLRQRPDTAQAPIVLLAYENGWLPSLRSKLSAFTDTLAKPISPLALRAMILKHCPADDDRTKESWPELQFEDSQ
jgi:CheY-like chemotaxis protein